MTADKWVHRSGARVVVEAEAVTDPIAIAPVRSDMGSRVCVICRETFDTEPRGDGFYLVGAMEVELGDSTYVVHATGACEQGLRAAGNVEMIDNMK